MNALKWARWCKRECRCRSKWCFLDALLVCHIGWICDRHDAHILGSFPAAGRGTHE